MQKQGFGMCFAFTWKEWAWDVTDIIFVYDRFTSVEHLSNCCIFKRMNLEQLRIELIYEVAGLETKI